MSASAVRGWVKQDEAGEGIGGMGILSNLERQELLAHIEQLPALEF